MIELTLGEIAAAVGGRLHRSDGTRTVTGSVEFDSRSVGPGDLFVALPGERVDGHAFAGAAVAAGAVAVLAAREMAVPSIIVPRSPAPLASGAYVLAGDADGSGAAVLAALARLARAVVDRLPGLTVVGITGSSGKTSTKDLTAALLRPLGPTIAPPGSFNNELGHPWTVLRAQDGTRHLVLELSARGPGHIAALCAVAPPRIGVVVNVGSAHLGEFGSREAIATAKGELVEALPSAADGGVAVLNADDPLVAAMAGRTAARVVLAGRAEHAGVRAAEVRLDERGRASFHLVTPYGDAPVRLAVHGGHQVGNALAAAAVALELGATVAQVADGLSHAAPVSRWRMEVTDRRDGVTVVNDAYNANPESVNAALHTLATMSGGRRRSWAVLGPLGELGDAADEAHEEIGRQVARLGVDRLVVVGEQARAMHRGALLERAGLERAGLERTVLERTGPQPGGPAPTGPERTGEELSGLGLNGRESVLVPDVEAATALLREELRPGDVVLVKASRAFGLERIADALLEDPT